MEERKCFLPIAILAVGYAMLNDGTHHRKVNQIDVQRQVKWQHIMVHTSTTGYHEPNQLFHAQHITSLSYFAFTPQIASNQIQSV